VNGTLLALLLLAGGAFLVWAGMTGTSLLTALAFGPPAAAPAAAK
jgi:hypothetical protein